MKAKYIASVSAALAMTLASCESFTEIDQKGMNLLSKCSDLELLLNGSFQTNPEDVEILCGDVLSSNEYVPEMLSRTNKTENQILTAWDEEGHANILQSVTTDGFYGSCFGKVGRIANPILERVDEAEGTQAEKDKLKSEALTLRAYYTFLCAQKYAKVYDPATADTEMSIPWLPVGFDIEAKAEKVTQKELYTNILADLNEAIKIDGIPLYGINRERLSKPFPYVAKAIVLLTMRDYDGALAAAEEAIELNGVINDYGEYLMDDVSWMTGEPWTYLSLAPSLSLEEDIFTDVAQEFFHFITPFNESMFEPGSYKKDYAYTMYRSSMGMYDPEDPEMDRMYALADNEMMYGVPYDLTYDLDGYTNTIGLKTTYAYLVKAECLIQKGQIDDAMATLDGIRVNRISPDYYEPLQGAVTDKAEAIDYLKKAAHGEYVYTQWNFINRKRWTAIDGFKETFVKELCGNTYTLRPDSPMWVFPFPREAVLMNPNLTNNF